MFVAFENPLHISGGPGLIIQVIETRVEQRGVRWKSHLRCVVGQRTQFNEGRVHAFIVAGGRLMQPHVDDAPSSNGG